MARGTRKSKKNQTTGTRRTESGTRPEVAVPESGLPAEYLNALKLGSDGQYEQALALYAQLEQSAAYSNLQLRPLIQNDLAVFAAMEEKFDEACEGWRASLISDPECMSARLNLDMVEADLSVLAPTTAEPPLKVLPAPETHQPVATENPDSGVRNPIPNLRGPTRIAVLSFLFNWPSTGGGNMHTAGLVEFLGRAGYDVRHFYARYPAWAIGRVKDDEYLGGERRPRPGTRRGRRPPDAGRERRRGRRPGHRTAAGSETREQRKTAVESRPPVRTAAGSETRAERRTARRSNSPRVTGMFRHPERFRVPWIRSGPITWSISDTWNMKPHLAEAMRGYPCLLHVQAQECLCPLNNLRLLGIGPTQVEQCPRNQLATPQVCHQCLAERGHHAGALHQHERALAGVGTAEYDRLLRQSFRRPRPCSCSTRSPPR